MSQAASNLMVATVESVAWVKIAGRANFALSVDFKRLVDELQTRGFAQLVFDLADCVTMDSTFLGVLAGIGLAGAESRPGRETGCVTLLNPSPRVAELLESLGIVHLFRVLYGNPMAGSQFTEVQPAAAASKREVSETCLAAHQTLMAINPANIPKFKDVARFIAEDLRKTPG